MERGVVGTEPPTTEDVDEEGQEDGVEEERGPLPVRSTAVVVVVELLLWGDSSLISIWFFRGPVEMFWMLYWLMVDIEVGMTEEDEEEEQEEETPEEEAWLPEGRMEGAWEFVGELIGM